MRAPLPTLVIVSLGALASACGGDALEAPSGAPPETAATQQRATITADTFADRAEGVLSLDLRPDDFAYLIDPRAGRVELERIRLVRGDAPEQTLQEFLRVNRSALEADLRFAETPFAFVSPTRAHHWRGRHASCLRRCLSFGTFLLCSGHCLDAPFEHAPFSDEDEVRDLKRGDRRHPGDDRPAEGDGRAPDGTRSPSGSSSGSRSGSGSSGGDPTPSGAGGRSGGPSGPGPGGGF